MTTPLIIMKLAKVDQFTQEERSYIHWDCKIYQGHTETRVVFDLRESKLARKQPKIASCLIPRTVIAASICSYYHDEYFTPGHLDILKVLVGKFGKEIASLKDSRSTTPVFFAAQQG